jgi:23S rRNA (cytosine1962-C5)-methyltransferase
MLILTLKQGKEQLVLAGDPLIYVSAIERVEGKFFEQKKFGATCLVRASDQTFLARAGWSPASQVRARVWSLDESEAIDHAFFKRRIKEAISKRLPLKKQINKPQRLVNAEEDGLPGLVVEYHAVANGFLVCQFQAAGVDAWKVPIVKALIAETACPNVYEHTNYLIRKGEGLPVRSGVLAGEEPPANLQAK